MSNPWHPFKQTKITLQKTHQFNGLVEGKNYRKTPWSSWENLWFPVKIFPTKPIHWSIQHGGFPGKKIYICIHIHIYLYIYIHIYLYIYIYTSIQKKNSTTDEWTEIQSPGCPQRFVQGPQRGVGSSQHSAGPRLGNPETLPMTQNNWPQQIAKARKCNIFIYLYVYTYMYIHTIYIYIYTHIPLIILRNIYWDELYI